MRKEREYVGVRWIDGVYDMCPHTQNFTKDSLIISLEGKNGPVGEVGIIDSSSNDMCPSQHS